MSRNTGEEPPQPPKIALLQTEPLVVSGAPRNLDINGDAAHNARAANDINNTVNNLNAHPVYTDSESFYNLICRYCGAHDDYMRSSNHNEAHNDFEGSTNYNGAHNDDIRRSSAGNRAVEERRLNPPYHGPYAPHSTFESMMRPEEYDYVEAFMQTRRESHEDFQFQHELGSNRKTSNGESRRPASPEEVEEPGQAQLRQCVQKFLAKWFSGKDLMSDLADTLINAGWDRETLADSGWVDVKDAYKGSGWTSPTFVRLRKICKE
ncbi:hypothetical protein DFH05DRAFT_1459419 [Lentinula detonsa]|uniref:Uncharacterized protein n=1 Tax=Lentinula detonsa TaxID=2804962 RepID=A0A9W8P311_9AGAR|nr:hypothetical protein DFH05DRAFT_1459419 [Lentinula detonsa]